MSDLESHLAHIERWNPHVEALIDWDRFGAIERAGKVLDGPLCGWSVAVKDIIDLAGVPTRCNAPFVPAQPAMTNAAIVDELINQGAFVMAKSATTTFAYADPATTRNPWNLRHTPGGSSSGSAAAVACGMVRLALGTQTVGSINRPAAFCGVVGFKPTYGTLPMEGVFPFSKTVDTMGFFTATAADAQDAFAALTAQAPANSPTALRIGVALDLHREPAEPSMAKAVQAAAGRLQDAGHHVQEHALSTLFEPAHEHHWNLIAAELAKVHENLFARHGKNYTPKLRQLIETGRKVHPKTLEAIASHRTELISSIDSIFEGFDLLLCPSAAGPAPRGLEATGDPRMNLPWTYCATPTVTLPAALGPGGLPLGIQLSGRRGSDRTLLAAAVTIEKLLQFHQRPPDPVSI